MSVRAQDQGGTPAGPTGTELSGAGAVRAFSNPLPEVEESQCFVAGWKPSEPGSSD